MFSLVWIAVFFTCHAQSQFRVSDPRPEIRGDLLHVYYDILNSNPEDEFIITLLVEDDAGNAIDVKAVEGDVGSGIRGGLNRHLVWDYEADDVFISAELTIRINARPMLRPEPIVLEEPPAKTQKTDTGETRKTETGDVQTMEEDSQLKEQVRNYSGSPSRGSLVLQSLVFPGLGLSRVTGKPHWIKGVVGYGCLAGSLLMNRKAIATVDSFQDLESENELFDAFDQSVNQDNVSEILAYTALGVWVTDLVWTIVGTSGMSGNPSYAHQKGLSLKSDFDPVSRAPLVGVIYRF